MIEPVVSTRTVKFASEYQFSLYSVNVSLINSKYIGVPTGNEVDNSASNVPVSGITEPSLCITLISCVDPELEFLKKNSMNA